MTFGKPYFILALLALIFVVGCTNAVPTITQLRSIIVPQEKGGVVQDKSMGRCFRQTPSFAGLVGSKILVGGAGDAVGRCRQNPVIDLSAGTPALTDQRLSFFPYEAINIQFSGSLSDGSLIVAGDFARPTGVNGFEILKIHPTSGVSPLVNKYDGSTPTVWMAGDEIYILGSFSAINGAPRNGVATLNGLTGELVGLKSGVTSMFGCQEVVPFGNLRVFSGYNCTYGNFENRGSALVSLTDFALKEVFPSFSWISVATRDLATGDLFVYGDIRGDDLPGGVFRFSSTLAKVSWSQPFLGSINQMQALNGRLYVSGSLKTVLGEEFTFGYVNLGTNQLEILSDDLGFTGWIDYLKVSGGKLIVGYYVGGASRTSIGTSSGSGMTFEHFSGLDSWSSHVKVLGSDVYWFSQPTYDSGTGYYIYDIMKSSLSSRADVTVFTIKTLGSIYDWELDADRFYINSYLVQIPAKGTRYNMAVINRANQDFEHPTDLVDGNVYSFFVGSGEIVLSGGFMNALGTPKTNLASFNKTDLTLKSKTMNLQGYQLANGSSLYGPLFFEDYVIYTGVNLVRGTIETSHLVALNADNFEVAWSMNTGAPSYSSWQVPATRVLDGFLYFFDNANKFHKITSAGVDSMLDLGLNGNPTSFIVKDQKLYLIGSFSTVLGTSQSNWAVINLNTNQLESVAAPSGVTSYMHHFYTSGSNIYLTNLYYYYSSSVNDFNLFKLVNGAWVTLNLSPLAISQINRVHFQNDKLLLFGEAIESQETFKSLFLLDPLNWSGSKAFNDDRGIFYQPSAHQPDLLMTSDVSGLTYYKYDYVTELLSAINSTPITGYSQTKAALFDDRLYLEGAVSGQCLSKLQGGVRSNLVTLSPAGTCEVLSKTSSGVLLSGVAGSKPDGQTVKSNIYYYRVADNQLFTDFLPEDTYYLIINTKDYLLLNSATGVRLRVAKDTLAYDQTTTIPQSCNYSLFEGNLVYLNYCWSGDQTFSGKILDLATLTVSNLPLNINSNGDLKQVTIGEKKVIIGNIKKVNGKFYPTNILVYDPATGSYQ